MNGHKRVGSLIPGLANGSLSDDERREVEQHLSACAPCRELLELARTFREAGLDAERRLEDHVQAQLLVEFHERDPGLDSGTRARIEEHVARCTLCGEALTILEELAQSPPADSAAATPSWGRRVWRRLERTMLGPVPALAYLVLLAILLVPVWSNLRESARQAGSAPAARPVASLLPVVRLPDERRYRGSGSAPLLTLEPHDGPYVLELQTDIDEELLEDPDAALLLELLAGETTLLSEVLPASRLDSRGRLGVLVHAGQLGPAAIYVWRIRYHEPGDALHGEVVYRRPFRIGTLPPREGPAGP